MFLGTAFKDTHPLLVVEKPHTKQLQTPRNSTQDGAKGCIPCSKHLESPEKLHSIGEWVLQSDRPEFASWLSYLLVMWLWICQFISLCKTWIIIPISQRPCVEIRWERWGSNTEVAKKISILVTFPEKGEWLHTSAKWLKYSFLEEVKFNLDL